MPVIKVDDIAHVRFAAPDLAAMRAFLQRCDVRLSTMHRVATALLSGAGILVLLPSVERDTVIQVVRALLVGPLDWQRGLLIAAIAISIVLAGSLNRPIRTDTSSEIFSWA